MNNHSANDLTPDESKAFLDLEQQGYEFKTVKYYMGQKRRSLMFSKGATKIELPISTWKEPACKQNYKEVPA